MVPVSIINVLDPYPGSSAFWPPDPEWKKSGSGIRDKHLGSYFRKLGTNFLGSKYLNSLSFIQCCLSGTGVQDGKIQIREKSRMENPDPGSGINITGPQHCPLHSTLQARHLTNTYSHLPALYVLAVSGAVVAAVGAVYGAPAQEWRAQAAAGQTALCHHPWTCSSGLQQQVPTPTAFRIRIRTHMFLDHPCPDPIVRGVDPDPVLDPDASIIKQK